MEGQTAMPVEPGQASAARPRRLNSEARFGYLLLTPAAVLIAALIAYPTASALWLSLHQKVLGSQIAPWIGLDNYVALVSDGLFWRAARNTFVFTTGTVAIKLALGLSVALVLNGTLPLRSLWRSLILLPYALPTLVSVLIWRWMYNDTLGILNYLLKEAHLIQRPVLWLANPDIALGSVMAVNVWHGFPFFVIILLAGLQSVPQDLLEAVTVDGARTWGRFRDVTLPALTPVMAVASIFSTISTFNDFAVVWILTRGGPGDATEVLATLAYKVAIPGLELGKGVAVSVLMLPFLLLLIVLLSRLLNRAEERV